MALLLREKHVHALLSMHDTVAVLEEAFATSSLGGAINQPRSRLIFPHGVHNYFAAALPSYGVYGYKTYTAFRERLRSLVSLFHVQDGHLLALIEANWLGAMRTGGTSALATKYMAPREARTVGLIGAGNQAVTQAMGVCAVRPIQTMLVYCRRPQERQFFCDEMSSMLGIEVRATESAQQAVEGADIITTVTTAKDPVLLGDWLQPGCHVNAIGSNWAQRREIDSEVLKRSVLVVTDSVEQAEAEAGDLIIPANAGEFDWNDLYELAEVVHGSAPQRELPEDITLFKSVGIALEDIALATHVYNLAYQQGIGEDVPFLS